MVIYMNQYNTAKTARPEWRNNDSYGDEVMNASWNPDVIPLARIVHLAREAFQTAPSPDLPEDLSMSDADTFLDRVYGLATLI